MPRNYSPLSRSILRFVDSKPGSMLHEIYSAHDQKENKKSVYDTVFRLLQAKLLKSSHGLHKITDAGLKVIHKKEHQSDGIWKIVIFDIREKDRYVRNFLRQRLKILGFKRWQNSIWITPYSLDKAIEEELKILARQYFVRMIKSNEINYTKDLDQLFPSH